MTDEVIMIVGGGKMGLSHAALLAGYIGASNVLICDSSRATRIVFRGLGFCVVRSVESALGSGGVRAAIIATPTVSHAEVLEKLIGAGIPCLVEKPLTLDVGKSTAIDEQVANTGVYAQVGFVLRFLSSFIALKKIVDSGCLGRVLSYKASMRGSAVGPSSNLSGWRGDSGLGGGCLNEYGPHLLDLCLNVFGEVCAVENTIGESKFSPRADDAIWTRLHHENGIRGQIHMDWADQSLRKSVAQFEVEFDRGRISVDQSSLDLVEVPEVTHAGELERIISQSRVPPNVHFYLRGEEFSLQLEAFLANIGYREFAMSEYKGECALVKDGLAVDQLISDIRESERRN